MRTGPDGRVNFFDGGLAVLSGRRSYVLAQPMHNAPASLYPIRNAMGCCHLLVEDDGQSAVLIDAGFFGEMFFLRRLLRRLQLPPTAVRAILLTHGHLDHVGSLVAIRDWTGAPVLGARRRNSPTSRAATRTTGLSRVCGWLESARPRACCASPLARWIAPSADGDECSPTGVGWSVVHLPGPHARPLRLLQRAARPAFQRRSFRQLRSGTPTGRHRSSTACPPNVLSESFPPRRRARSPLDRAQPLRPARRRATAAAFRPAPWPARAGQPA